MTAPSRGRGVTAPTDGRLGRRRVVVIGGGLTGLAAAWHVRDEVDVTVLESSTDPGGQVRSVPFAGTRIDVGADAFLARQPEGERLVRAAGFGDDDLVAPATGQVYLWVRGRRRPLPAGTVLGAPADPVALVRSGVLPYGAVLRAGLEPVVPRREVVGDRSVADLVGERFGREVVDRLVEPLLGGVYAGSVDRLSAEATLPPVWSAAQRHRSLLRGLREHRARAAADDSPVFLTIRGGLGRVIDRLAADLGTRLQTGTAVTSLARTEDGGAWRITTDGGEHLVADGVILALPAAVASGLLRDQSPAAARELSGIRAASVGVVALAYAPEHVTDVPVGSGILVPRTEGRLVKAVTFSSRKWPHHAGHDHFLLRASVGRVDDATPVDPDDDRLVAAVEAEVRELAGIDGRADEAIVQRWPDSLPQYDVGHLARVDRLRAALREDAPGLHIGGASLDGVGLAARARDGERLAHEIRWDAGLLDPAGRTG